MASLDHCLITLQERDKGARLLSRDKSEEAFWAKDLPQDFTNFYNKWGLWEEICFGLKVNGTQRLYLRRRS
jgi:hypothetical protein